MSKKVGIITYHNGENHGALLQAYALCEALKKLDFSPEIINFTPIVKRKVNIKQLILKLLRLFAKNKDNFKNFTKEYIPISRKLPQNYDLHKLNSQYDYFITGSDQVWNPYAIDEKGAFYLAFVNGKNKKISYAPSFAVSSIPEGKKSAVKKYINDFNYISVREKTGQKIVKELCGRESLVVLDPTLLLNFSDWDKIAKKPNIQEPYIFVYFNSSKNLDDYAKKISAKTGYKIVVVHKTMINEKSNYIKHYDAKPTEFLGYIKHASIVLADSFHGTALSIAFNKPFVSYVSGSESTSSVDSRKIDLLEKLNLSDRLLIGDKIKIDNPFEIDYSSSYEILQEWRKESNEFLKNSLSEG